MERPGDVRAAEPKEAEVNIEHIQKKKWNKQLKITINKQYVVQINKQNGNDSKIKIQQ